MESPTSALSNNQLISGEGEGNYTWRYQPQYVKCQGCGFEGDTSVIRTCETKNLVIFFCCSTCLALYNLYHAKDHTCYTVQHVCPKCQKELGTFRPC
jgi:hypothetical protein